MNLDKSTSKIIQSLQMVFNFIGLINKYDNTHDSKKITNDLIYASNHLPHELLTIKEQFEQLISQGSKEKVLELINNYFFHQSSRLRDIEDLDTHSADDDLNNQITKILNNPDQSKYENIDEKFNDIIKEISKYIDEKLYEVTKVDCLRRAREIKEIQTKIIEQASHDSEKILKEIDEQKRAYNPEIIFTTEKELEKQKNNISEQIEVLKTKLTSKKGKYLQELQELKKTKEELETKLDGKPETSKFTYAPEWIEHEKKLLNLKLIDREKNLLNLKSEILADKQIIAFLEKSLEGIHKAANASQEVIKSMQLQTEIRLNIKNLDKHKPNENNKALSEHEERIAANTNEFYTNIYEFLLYANFAKNSEKRFSSLNKALQELFKHASFFSLKDKERNLENINLITQQEICKSDLLFKNFAELQEHILDHSAFQYFNTLETKSLETNEETARGNIQNSILEIMEKEYQYFYDKIAEEENERNAAKIIQKAFRNFKKNKIKQRIAEMNENAPIVTRYLKKIQHTYKSGLVIQKFMEYRKYRESMEKATTPELIENSTKRLQEAIISPEKINSNIVTLETQELDKSIFPLDDLLSSQSENLRLLSEELPFFKENQVEFEKIFSDSTSDQEKIEFLGDKSQEMKLELEKSSQLAYKILELIIEVKYIEPNKNNDNPELLSEKLITLSNDLKHQLNGIKEGNKDFFLKN